MVLRQQIYNIPRQQSRLQYQPTIHLWRGLSFEEGEEVYKIFSTGAVIFTRGILTRRRNRQQGKSCLCCTEIEVSKMRNGDILFTKEKWPSVVWTARYFSRLSALNKANLLNGVVSASLEDEYIDLLHLRSQPHSSELSFWFFFHFFVLFCFAFFWIKLRLNVTGTTVLSRMAHWVKL